MSAFRFERALAVALLAAVPSFAFGAIADIGPAPSTALTAERVASPADDLIATELKRSLDKVLEKSAMLPVEHKAVEAFYAAREFAPLWIHDGRLTAAGRAAIARLKNAAGDGLEPADYRVPDFDRVGGADALAVGDVDLTSALLRFTRHLATGRIAPHRVTSEVEYGDHTPDPREILQKLAAATDVDAAIESYNPPHPVSVH